MRPPAFSAGTAPAGASPGAVAAMAEIAIDIRELAEVFRGVRDEIGSRALGRARGLAGEATP